MPTHRIRRPRSRPAPRPSESLSFFHRLGLAALLAALAAAACCPAAETITVDGSTTHQTIEAWGMAGGHWIYSQKDSLRPHLLRLAVDELGLSRTRVEAQSGSGENGPRFELYNDDGDPTNAVAAGFANTVSFDDRMVKFTVPFKTMVEARGMTFSCYFSPSFYDSGSTGGAPTWIRQSPGEAAEHLLGYLLRMKNVHGVTPTFSTILNEPAYHNSWNTAFLAECIRELGPRLAAAGLPTRIQFPEGVSASAAWNHITAVQSDPTVWPYIGMLSYHLYGTNDPQRASIRDFGIAQGIPRAQTEFLHQTVDVLYDDLVNGGVSVWELYGWGQTYLGLTADWVSRGPRFWGVRQVTRYVPQGSQRIGTTSTSASLRPLAFRKAGSTVVVIWNTTGGGATTANLSGLAPGTYVVCHTTSGGSGTFFADGTVTASASGVISGLAIPSSSVVTVYPQPGNQPPVLKDWKASSHFLTQPASSLTLSANAVDEDLDPVTYAWSLISQPVGASVVLATPATATCGATGLSAAGDYVFGLAVSDGTHVVNRTLELTVHAANRPPEIGLHNRIPVLMTQPTSTTTLRVSIPDPEGDPVTVQWTVLSTPPGATVSLSAPTATSCDASGMTVAGDYVFRVTAQDPTHTVVKDLTVPVFPADQAAVISSATASPASLTQPAASTTLSAVTSDPDAASIAPWRGSNDVLTHWWVVKSKPAGASPTFGTPGSTTTTVSGLSVAGTYVFTVRAIGRDAMATKDVTVTVAAGSAAPEIAVTRGATPIADGSTDALGSLVAGTMSPVTYTLANTGSATLTLGSASLGTQTNCTVTVGTAPAASVASGASTTLVVQITPTAAGSWSAGLSVVTNDSDENPTNWTMSGTATAPAAPEIAVTRGATPVADGGNDAVGVLAAGSASPLTYTLANTGSATLTLGMVTIGTQTNCVVTVSATPAASVASGTLTTLVVQVTPAAAGSWSAGLNVVTNDSDEDPTDWIVSGTATAAPAPEIAVTRGATAVADGSTDVAGSLVAGSTSSLTYTLANVGTATLNLGSAVLGGQTNCTVAVATAPAVSVAQGASTSLVLDVTPATVGSWSLTLSISTNDSDENPSNWTISGTATAAPAPEIAVSRGGSALADGGSDIVPGLVAGTAASLTYVLDNVGTADLTLGVVALGGMSNCTATVAAAPASPVAASASTSLVLTVTPVSAGAWSLGLSVATNDGDEDPTDWTISGTASAAPLPPPVGGPATTPSLREDTDCGMGQNIALVLALAICAFGRRRRPGE